MKIAHVQTGIFPIPPNGWGAVEKIIWEYKLSLEKLGHVCDALYLNNIDPSKYDVIHVHLANLALELYERKIPYYFTCHDHHAFLYGKDSYCFKQNYEAILHSVKSFVPAKYLVDYFNLSNLEYISHGVNLNVFKSSTKQFEHHKLLCVANNGFIHDQSEDRKGFTFAIEAAKILNLPITVAGPKNNKNFFDKNNFNYDKLTIMYDLTEEELIKVYNDHTIFLHPSILEAGHPNLTLVEAIGSGLPIVGTFEKDNDLPGLVRVTRNTEEIVVAIKNVMSNYEFFKNLCVQTAKNKSWENITLQLISAYNSTMKTQLENIYDRAIIKHIEPKKASNRVEITVNDGCKVEISGPVEEYYNIKFVDNKNGSLVYESNINNNMWCTTSARYYIDWKVIITEKSTGVVTEHKCCLSGKRVRITNESPSLGDTIAWMPMVDAFQKKHNCIVDFYTPLKDIFTNIYKNINFFNYDQITNGSYYATYRIGCYDPTDKYKSPRDWRTLNLQQIAADILGIEWTETKIPFVPPSSYKNKFNKKYVCIGSLSTAQAKLWNNPDGWVKTIDYLKTLGYEVVSIDKNYSIGNGKYHNAVPAKSINKTGDFSLDDRMNDLYFCDFFIGLGSGLSWLAWMVNKPVILISGFSDPISEFYTPYRVHNKSVCNSCWNDTDFKFDSSKWDWCPRNKEFECSKQITFEMVKEKIDECIINIKK